MMMKGCRRQLDSLISAEEFAQNILKATRGRVAVARSIMKAEFTVAFLEPHQTDTHKEYREPEYRDDDRRSALHKRIRDELITLPRLEHDDMIRLGKGGAKPATEKNDAQAYIVMGSPASGKSGIAERLADENGAYILDSDYAKRKFPEYRHYKGGASLVHREADKIIFNSENSLFVHCVYNRCNMVIPLVGRTVGSVEDICLKLMEAQYRIHIIDVALDRYQCVCRAYRRFQKTNRYVPLSYVFDEVGNEPERIYFLIKRAYAGHDSFVSFSQLSTDVPEGEPPKVLECSAGSPIRFWGTEQAE